MLLRDEACLKPDLRQSLTQLELASRVDRNDPAWIQNAFFVKTDRENTSEGPRSTESAGTLIRLKRAFARAELASCVDAFLARREWLSIEVRLCRMSDY
jgi:hypothetical protein